MRRLAWLAVLVGCKHAPERAAETAEPPTGAVDSHVHLDYWDVADQLAANGVVAAVDLGGPIERLDDKWPLLVIGSGPMISSPDGYPADAWAPPSYRIGCADADCARDAVDRLQKAGARVIKMPFAEDGIDPAVGAVVAARAHELGLPVACHALGDADAAAAAVAGCDILAHTPVEPLRDETVQAWKGKTVITTLHAFGGSADAVENLRKLRAAGLLVLYGTDLGNDRVAGIDPDELRLMGDAGMTEDEIETAMTTAPIAFWKLDVTASR